MADIIHNVIINASSETVYDAITTHQGLSRWWIENCTIKPEVGFTNEFRVEGHGIIKMKITDLQPNRRVEWICENEGPDDQWTSTRISFEIEHRDSNCMLAFRHAGWAEATEFFGICSFHWARHLGMLIELCEKGSTTLNQEVERREVRKVVGNGE